MTSKTISEVISLDAFQRKKETPKAEAFEKELCAFVNNYLKKFYKESQYPFDIFIYGFSKAILEQAMILGILQKDPDAAKEFANQIAHFANLGISQWASAYASNPEAFALPSMQD